MAPRTPWRRHGVPAEALAGLTLQPGERVLAGAHDEAGAWTVGTDRALHLAGGPSLRWEQVERASYDDEAQRLSVVEVADFGRAQPRHDLALQDPRRLLDLVRERVTASVLLTRHVPVAGSRGIKVVARRSPTRTGEVVWSSWLSDGLDPSDPAVLAAVEAGLAAARADLGL